MAFEPPPLTQRQRSAAYGIHVAGALCTMAILVLHFTTGDRHGLGVLIGGASGGLLAALVPSRMDEYFNSLCSLGYRCVTSLMGAYLFLSWLVVDLHDDGMPRSVVSLAFSDPMLVACCAALVYYLGFGFAWWRDRLPAE